MPSLAFATAARALEAAQWLSDHLEVLGAGSVLAFLFAIVGAVALAPFFSVGQSEIEAAKPAQTASRLHDYLRRAALLVRLERACKRHVKHACSVRVTCVSLRVACV